MALREYVWRGNTWQFEEAEAPADAVPVEVDKKAARTAKSRKAATPNKAKVPAANKKRRTPTKKEK